MEDSEHARSFQSTRSGRSTRVGSCPTADGLCSADMLYLFSHPVRKGKTCSSPGAGEVGGGKDLSRKEQTMRQGQTRRSAAVVDGSSSPWRGDRPWFDWSIAVLSAWLVGGAFIDGWAHTHGKVDTTFFTRWHAAFYTGFLAVAGALIGALLHHTTRRGTWLAGASPWLQPVLTGRGNLWVRRRWGSRLAYALRDREGR